MPKIKIGFKKASSMKYSLKVTVDNDKTITIANGLSKEVELSEGDHEIEASIPYKGNDAYISNVNFNVKPNNCYEIDYSLSAFASNGVLAIKEIPLEYNENDNTSFRANDKVAVNIIKTKMNIDYIKVLAVVMTFAILVFGLKELILMQIESIMLNRNMGMSDSEYFPNTDGDDIYGDDIYGDEYNGTHNIVITELNSPETMGGMKMSATEVSTNFNNSFNEDVMQVRVKIVVENISDQNVRFAHINTSVYVDDVLKRGRYMNEEMTEEIRGLFYGININPQRRMVINYVVDCVKSSEEIEVIIPLDDDLKNTVTFALKIPIDRV